MKNREIIIMVLILIIIITGVLLLNKSNKKVEAPTGGNTEIVGNDRDPHDCIPSAGYTWCEAKSKCLRVWEEKCEVENIITPPAGVTIDQNICELKGGVWYSADNTCEKNSLTKEECLSEGGEFNECASACRHDKTAEVCTMQCVLTCTFK